MCGAERLPRLLGIEQSLHVRSKTRQLLLSIHCTMGSIDVKQRRNEPGESVVQPMIMPRRCLQKLVEILDSLRSSVKIYIDRLVKGITRAEAETVFMTFFGAEL